MIAHATKNQSHSWITIKLPHKCTYFLAYKNPSLKIYKYLEEDKKVIFSPSSLRGGMPAYVSVFHGQLFLQ